jgi:small subunit ribosomal protein S8
MTDPVADLLTRIRNAQRNFFDSVESPSSKSRLAVLDVLKREGYIRGYSLLNEDQPQPTVKVQLKYDSGQPVIREIQRVSKPGRRVYSSLSDLPSVRGGLGISVLTTSKGVMSDAEARLKNVGGEVICQVF